MAHYVNNVKAQEQELRECRPLPRQPITDILHGFPIWRVSMVIQITKKTLISCYLSLQSYPENFINNRSYFVEKLLDFLLDSQHSDPDCFQNLITCSFYHLGPFYKISSLTDHNVFSNASEQTNRQKKKDK